MQGWKHRSVHVLCKHSEGVTNNSFMKCRISWNAERTKWCNEMQYSSEISLDYFFLCLYIWPVYQFKQRAIKISERLMMIMFKSIKIYNEISISLSPRLKARDSWQVKIFIFTTLSNIRQTEVVVSNDPFVQGVYVPVLSFSVTWGPVYLFSAFLPGTDLTLSLHRFSKWGSVLCMMQCWSLKWVSLVTLIYPGSDLCLHSAASYK